MNAFEQLAASGSQTAREIQQQPAAWRRTFAVLDARRAEVSAFLAAGGPVRLILAGAGSSEYAGRSVEAALRRTLTRDVTAVPTTHLVTHAETVFLPGRDEILVSLARSGNSPESMASFRRVREQFPRVRHLVITCNRDGELARAALADSGALCLLLPEETNDASLVMTSSFSSLALACLSLGFLDSPGKLEALVETAARGAARVMGTCGDALKEFAGLPFTRACFLGSHALFAVMQEARLKIQEMTAGRIVSLFDSFLGLRHGPQVFVNGECVVIAALSASPAVRRYELDLLRELRDKKQGMGTLVICARADAEVRSLAGTVIELFPDGEPLPDDCRVLTDIVACQILATFTSIGCGLSPDNPSPEGIINRVVRGVTIYPW
jgi:tagatose-6-phosphate ketose/aldose isomerase